VNRVIGHDGRNLRFALEKENGMGRRSIKWRSMEPIKVLIILVLLAIVGSLGSALFHLSRGNRSEEDSRKMARALTIRIGLSLALFLMLMAAWYFGLIKPTGT
jgi:hypothetical protein